MRFNSKNILPRYLSQYVGVNYKVVRTISQYRLQCKIQMTDLFVVGIFLE